MLHQALTGPLCSHPCAVSRIHDESIWSSASAPLTKRSVLAFGRLSLSLLFGSLQGSHFFFPHRQMDIFVAVFVCFLFNYESIKNLKNRSLYVNEKMQFFMQKLLGGFPHLLVLSSYLFHIHELSDLKLLVFRELQKLNSLLNNLYLK